MKICLIGGHMNPALALLDYIPHDWKIIFLGRKYTFEGDPGISLEYRILSQKEHIRFYEISAGRLQRKLTSHTMRSLPKIPLGYIQALRILRKEKPDVVVGFGGYVSLSVGLAAKTLRIPLVIHEQTLGAGLANRILRTWAEKICISWDSSKKYFPSYKTVMTGNLLRKEISESLAASKKLHKNTSEFPLLYITGGSGGAHAINQLVASALPTLLMKYSIIHQTGDAKVYSDYERLLAYKQSLSSTLAKRYTVLKFIEPSDIGRIYEQAYLVISRSGVNTMTELLVMQKPCMLIPLPYGAGNEQSENAAYVKNTGLGIVLKQEYVTGDSLISAVDEVMAHIDDFVLHTKIDVSIHIQAAKQMVELLTAYEKKENNKS